MRWRGGEKTNEISHINSDSFLPPKTKEWAAHQIATTRGDYAYESLLWNRLSIGLKGVPPLLPNGTPVPLPRTESAPPTGVCQARAATVGSNRIGSR